MRRRVPDEANLRFTSVRTAVRFAYATLSSVFWGSPGRPCDFGMSSLRRDAVARCDYGRSGWSSPPSLFSSSRSAI